MRLPSIKETRQEAYRYQIEAGQHLDLRCRDPFLFLREDSVIILNLMVVPSPDWKPSGHPGELILLFGDKPMYRAPIEILMAEWQRYRVGAAQLFRPLVVPIKQGLALRVDTKYGPLMVPTLVDMLVNYKRDVA